MVRIPLNLVFAVCVALCAAAITAAQATPFEDGKRAWEKGDYATAFHYWEPLAMNGEPDAENGLGSLYELGQVVGQDDVEAIYWYRKAAAKGFDKAEYNLGRVYRMGHGVSTDESLAFHYFMLAAVQGYGPAQNAVAEAYAFGFGVAEDDVVAYAWFTVAYANAPSALKPSIDADMYYLLLHTSADKIEEARRIAARCIQSHYQDCGRSGPE